MADFKETVVPRPWTYEGDVCKSYAKNESDTADKSEDMNKLEEDAVEEEPVSKDKT